MENYICIHGHFYQPPRENPWLEAVEEQDSASPYHDWNQRIASECYGPNSTATIVDGEGKIIDISDNYSKMSFNFGPTLLSWMKEKDEIVYRAIIEADKKSLENFSSHGAAIAQCYNHLIMPLANSRDKKTQVLWGIKDFEFHFSRKPLGMWLPETAVDIETLTLMAEEGIKFTILAPHQAKAFRVIGQQAWNTEAIDTKRHYLCNLPSGKSIILFFYNGSVSQDVAFGKLLDNGDLFAEALIRPLKKQNELSHIAVDGETFGHHHKFGEMALAYLFRRVANEKNVKNIVYSLFSEKFKPEYEAEVIENTSWSCAHGVGRWKEDCGCCLSYNTHWNQKWREHLRKALDFLRDSLIPLYEKKMAIFAKDPWQVRDNYIEVVLDRSKENVEKFFIKNCRELKETEKIEVLKLLETERMCMLMYTSCGFFFDDISTIETLQILLYAARVIQLANEVFDLSLEEKFTSILQKAKSNNEKLKDGAFIYETLVKPKVFDLQKVGAHYTISSLFEKRAEKEDIYCYSVETSMHEILTSHERKLSIGKASIFSKITWEKAEISFVAIHYAEENVLVGISDKILDKDFLSTAELLKKAFNTDDVESIKNLILEHFTAHHFSFWDLFPDDQRKILKKLLCATLCDIKESLAKAHRVHFDLIKSMKEQNIPLPMLLVKSLDLMINARLLDILEKPELNLGHLKRIAEIIKEWSFEIDISHVSYHALSHVQRLFEKFSQSNDIALLRQLNDLLEVFSSLPLTWNLCRVQSMFFSIYRTVYKEQSNKAKSGDAESQKWIENFIKFGVYLRIKI